MGGDDELVVRAAIRDELSGPLAAIREEIRATGETTKKAGDHANLGSKGFDRATTSLWKLGKVGAKAAVYGVAGVAAGLAGLVAWGVKSAIGIQTATMNLTTLTGSAKTAAKMVKQLNAYGNATTFDTQGLTEAAQQMLTYGIATKDVMPDIKMLGDIAMGNQEKLSGLAYVFAQVQGNGHLMGQDLLQMINQGFNPLTGIAKRTGKSMGELRKEMAAGQISFDMVKQSMVDATKKGGQFYQGAKNGSKTVAGAWGNMTGTISSELGLAFKPTLPLIQRLFGRISDYATSKSKAISKSVRDLVIAGKIGPEQFANVLGSKLGIDLVGPLHKLKGIVHDVSTVFTGSLVPAIKDAKGALGPFAGGGIGAALAALHLMAGHTTATKVALELLAGALTVAKLASIYFTAAEKVSLIWLKLHTVGTMENTVVTKAAAAASKVWAAAQWVLNNALRDNPIGIIITVLALLVGGLILAYKHSETFRKIVDGCFHGIATAAKWMWEKVLRPLFKMWVDVWLGVVGALVHGAAKAFGWVPGLGGKLKDAAAGFDRFKDSVNAALSGIHDKDVYVRVHATGAQVANLPGITKPRMLPGGPLGDTATRRGRGAGGIANTLRAHQMISGSLGGRYGVSNAFIGGGGHGRGSGDHQAGRAVDVVGSNLPAYARKVREAGGYAAIHGSGGGRHVHAVMGDTSTPRSGRVNTGSGTTVMVAEGAVQVIVQSPSSDVDVERAVRRAWNMLMRAAEEASD